METDLSQEYLQGWKPLKATYLSVNLKEYTPTLTLWNDISYLHTTAKYRTLMLNLNTVYLH